MRSINKAQGGYGDTQPMNCVAKEPEARSLPLGESRVGGKLGYVTVIQYLAIAQPQQSDLNVSH
jgi:hypothetical protein